MTREPTGQSHLIQALSLYVLLLAFFIALTRLSGAEPRRAEAVAGSLATMFRAEGRPAQAPSAASSLVATAIGDSAPMVRLGELIRTEFAFGRVRDVVPGAVMEFTVAAGRLFRPGDSAIDPLFRRLLERVAATLADPPPGVRYDVDIAHGVAASADGPAVRLAAARAAFLGAVLSAAGAPPRTLATGVEPGAPDRLRLLFHVRPADEPPPPFAAPDRR